MKVSWGFGVLVIFWIIIAYLIVGITDAIHGITFGLYTHNFAQASYYAFETVKYSLEVLMGAGVLFMVGVLPTVKMKAGFLLIIASGLTVYLIYIGLQTYAIP